MLIIWVFVIVLEYMIGIVGLVILKILMNVLGLNFREWSDFLKIEYFLYMFLIGNVLMFLFGFGKFCFLFDIRNLVNFFLYEV